MFVGVGLRAVPVRIVLVLMMFVVGVSVCVGERLVDMFVLVVLSQMQPHTPCHANCRDPERPSRRLAIQNDGQCASYERRSGKIGPRSGRPEIAQCENKQHQAQSVAQEPQSQTRCQRARSRQMLLEHPGNYNIGATGCEPFDGGNGSSITAGNSSREIVVERPTRAGCRNRDYRADALLP